MKHTQSLSIFWFRRDLRLDDNHGLYQSLSSDLPILPVFIFDADILETLDKDDHRVGFIHHQLSKMNELLQEKYSTSLQVFHGKPRDILNDLSEKYDIDVVYTNHDYEPYGKKRDQEIQDFLASKDIQFKTYKDQVIFEKSEIVKDDKKPYVVYTPYMKRWRARFNPNNDLTLYDTNLQNYVYMNPQKIISLLDIGFKHSNIIVPHYNITADIVNNYGNRRDFPAQSATSFVGTYLRFGVISIRKLFKKALESDDDTYIKELIWREFFMQILWHFPYTQHQAFRAKYDMIPWRDAPSDLQKWKGGQTGYPLVDAGMRELNQTGYMHNRVRMVVASFLCKHLLIDWREGERYFAEKLFDYELSSNIGNWQWAAGSGVDAAPYFRIFNPETQMKKFDPQGAYVRKWVPEYFGIGYIPPMVDHKFGRERAIETYKITLNNFDN
jgi:deoxyribodipyrimidine photo-lyase